MTALSGAAIEAALRTAWLGRPVFHFACVGSTNAVARQMAEDGARAGTLVIAEEQSAGRGRLGRSWWAPPGSSLLLSVVLRPELPAAHVHRLTMAAGLATAEAMEACTGIQPELKWPNDLEIVGRKVAGLLTDVDIQAAAVRFAVVGIGLNVNVDFREDGPSELRGRAIGLAEVAGRPVDRLSLLLDLLARLESRYDRLRNGESPLADWAARLVTIGRQVRVTTLGSGLEAPDRIVDGEAVGVDDNGALLVRMADGQTTRVLAGDVTLREDNGRGG